MYPGLVDGSRPTLMTMTALMGLTEVVRLSRLGVWISIDEIDQVPLLLSSGADLFWFGTGRASLDDSVERLKALHQRLFRDQILVGVAEDRDLAVGFRPDLTLFSPYSVPATDQRGLSHEHAQVGGLATDAEAFAELTDAGVDYLVVLSDDSELLEAALAQEQPFFATLALTGDDQDQAEVASLVERGVRRLCLSQADLTDPATQLPALRRALQPAWEPKPGETVGGSFLR